MEDLPFFQAQDEQFSAGGIYFPDEGVDDFSTYSTSGIFDTKDDLQLLFDWQDHMTSIQDTFCDDLDLKLNIDLKCDMPDVDSPILSNALTCPVPIKVEPETKRNETLGEKILFPGDVEPLQVSSSIQTDNVLKRITQARSMLINGEKEILGKNIIGLHCLNEIKTSPDENCQITSTVINGKRYKIIIKPKSSSRSGQQPSQKNKCVSESSYTSSLKMEPNDELITELQDGDYDVLGHDDVLDPWTLPLGSEEEEEVPPAPPVDPPRVPPLRIKIPKKTKKHKTKKEGIAVSNLGDLFYNFDGQSNPLKNASRNKKGARTSLLRPRVAQNAKPSPIVHAHHTDMKVPDERMQWDHDYCRYKRRQTSEPPAVLAEKNPRKDSGLESGGVSDASEEGPAPDSPGTASQSAPILAQQLTNKLLEERHRNKNHAHVTKMAAALFRAANAVTSGQKKGNVNSEIPDTIENTSGDSKTDTESAEFTAAECPLPQAIEKPKKKLNLEEYRNRRHEKDNDLSDGQVKNEVATKQEPEPDSLPECSASEVIKAEKYVNSAINGCEAMEIHINSEDNNSMPQDETIPKIIQQMKGHISPGPKKCELSDIKSEVHNTQRCHSLESANLKSQEVRTSRDGKHPRVQERRHSTDSKQTYQTARDVAVAGQRRRTQRRSSSSSTSGERNQRRIGSNRSRRGRSKSQDRRRSFWSPSRRSSSRDSSSSSGDSSNRRSSLSSFRYRRRSRTRSRSPYRSRSRDNLSRSRGFVNRRRLFPAYSRHSSKARSRSPVYSQREKQRQIEERRVVYVGRIPEGTTNMQLRQRFSVFGPICDISVHFRERGDNYGFVTFLYKDDAYQAVEHGNDNPALARYDLCFGGRRSFCKQRYSDLDGMPTSYSGFNDTPAIRSSADSFDLLLKQAKAKLQMRKEAT